METNVSFLMYDPTTSCAPSSTTVLAVAIILVAAASICSLWYILHVRAPQLKPFMEYDVENSTGASRAAFAEVAFLVSGFEPDYWW